MVWLRQTIPLAEIKRLDSVEAGRTSEERTSVSNDMIKTCSAVVQNKREISDLDLQIRRRKNSSGLQNSTRMNMKDQPGSFSVDCRRDSTKDLMDTLRPVRADACHVNEDISHLNQRQTTAGERNTVAMEWRTLALIVDRLFFILYLLIMAISLATVVLMTEVVDMTLLLINRNAISLTED